MKVTIQQLLESREALQTLAQGEYPARLSYRLARLVKSAQGELQGAQEAHVQLVKRLGVEIAPEQWQVPQGDAEKMAEFQREYDGLVSVIVEVWGDPIPIAEFGDAPLKPAMLSALDWLIVE